ncbi:MAG: hypothetical protein HYS98_07025, partial [Deltaproteobacteria bacterium]|nr:hypothetical protein [Deltaproteobacteria bacterium]
RAFLAHELYRLVWAYVRDALYHVAEKNVRHNAGGLGQELVQHLLKAAKSSEYILKLHIEGGGAQAHIKVHPVELPGFDSRDHDVLAHRAKLERMLIDFSKYSMMQPYQSNVPYPTWSALNPGFEDQLFQLIKDFALNGGEPMEGEVVIGSTLSPEQRIQKIAECIDRWVVQAGLLENLVEALMREMAVKDVAQLSLMRIFRPLQLKTVSSQAKIQTIGDEAAVRTVDEAVLEVRGVDPSLQSDRAALASIRNSLENNGGGGVRIRSTLAQYSGTDLFNISLFEKSEHDFNRVLRLDHGVNPLFLADAIAHQYQIASQEREVWLVKRMPSEDIMRRLLWRHKNKFLLLVLEGDVPRMHEEGGGYAISLQVAQTGAADDEFFVKPERGCIRAVVEARAQYYQTNWYVRISPQVLSRLIRVSVSSDFAYAFLDALVLFKIKREEPAFKLARTSILEIQEADLYEFILNDGKMKVLETRAGDPHLHPVILSSVKDAFNKLSAYPGTGEYLQTTLGLQASKSTDIEKMALIKVYKVRVAMLSNWLRQIIPETDSARAGRALLSIDTSKVSKLSTSELTVLRVLEMKGIHFKVVEEGQSAFVEGSDIYVSQELIDQVEPSVLLGVLYHEDFHRKGYVDEESIDQAVVKKLLLEEGRECALAYIEFLGIHGPRYLSHCYYKMTGGYSHLYKTTRAARLKVFLEQCELNFAVFELRSGFGLLPLSNDPLLQREKSWRFRLPHIFKGR